MTNQTVEYVRYRIPEEKSCGVPGRLHAGRGPARRVAELRGLRAGALRGGLRALRPAHHLDLDRGPRRGIPEVGAVPRLPRRDPALHPLHRGDAPLHADDGTGPGGAGPQPLRLAGAPRPSPASPRSSTTRSSRTTSSHRLLGLAPEHAVHVALWLGEVFGGPPAYSEAQGGHGHMVAKHLGKNITEVQRRRWVNLLQDAADDAGLPTDAEFRSAFLAYRRVGHTAGRPRPRTRPLRRPTGTEVDMGGSAVPALTGAFRARAGPPGSSRPRGWCPCPSWPATAAPPQRRTPAPRGR